MNTKKRGRPPKIKPIIGENTDDSTLIGKSAGESDYEREHLIEKSCEDQVALDEAGKTQSDIGVKEEIQVKVYRLCPNERYAMAILVRDGVPDTSEPLIQLECPRKVRDKLLGKIVKAATLRTSSGTYYYYVK